MSTQQSAPAPVVARDELTGSRRNCCHRDHLADPKHDTADQLTAWSGNVLEVTHHPAMSYEGNPVDHGHLFSFSRNVFGDNYYDEDEFGFLDDRKSEPLVDQIISELYRLAQVRLKLADRLERKLGRQPAALQLFAIEQIHPDGRREVFKIDTEDKVDMFLDVWKNLFKDVPANSTMVKRPVAWWLPSGDDQTDEDVDGALDLQPDPGAEDDLDAPLSLTPDVE